MARRAARTDDNQAELVAALRKVGWFVKVTSDIGDGWFDAIAARAGRIVYLEFKDGRKPPSARKLTKQEATLHEVFTKIGAEVRILTSVEDAIRL